MRKAGFICCVVLALTSSGLANPGGLPPVMTCDLIGIGGCGDKICTGIGVEDPSVTLTISRPSHQLILNGIAGRIDDRRSDPYSEGFHTVIWEWNLISYTKYQMYEASNLNVLKLYDQSSTLEFSCLGKEDTGS